VRWVHLAYWFTQPCRFRSDCCSRLFLSEQYGFLSHDYSRQINLVCNMVYSGKGYQLNALRVSASYYLSHPITVTDRRIRLDCRHHIWQASSHRNIVIYEHNFITIGWLLNVHLLLAHKIVVITKTKRKKHIKHKHIESNKFSQM